MAEYQLSDNETRLSTQHKIFAEAYLANGFNGQAAAITAKYSEKRARITASEVLRRTDVRTYLNQRMRQMQMSADEALFRLGEHARGNVSDFIGLTADEIKLHPRAYLIKKLKLAVYVLDNPETAPKDPDLAQALFSKFIPPETTADQVATDGQEKLPQVRAISYVESVELHDAQTAILNILKQHQLASGLPTEIIHIAPTIGRLMEALTSSGKDPSAVFERMIQRMAEQEQHA